MKRFLSRFFLSAVCAMTVTATAVAVTDEELLEDLGADLLEPAENEESSVLDEQLLQDLGEDVGLEKQVKNKQLANIVFHMKEARARLNRLESNHASSAQQYALTGLDGMIAELTEKKRQCSGGECKKPSDPKSNKKPGNPKKPGKNPATASSTRTELEDKSTSLVAVGDLVRDLWGHLPERQREQILQPLGSEYLPKYAPEIEAYFRDLAQPQDKTR